MRQVLHTIRNEQTLSTLDCEHWDSLGDPHFPFADHAYLSALERSGSVGQAAGWDPVYLTAWEGKRLAGASFLYWKTHSYGEYIFDWAWAQAYQAHAVPYYPKLVSAVPFTPATGSKLLAPVGSQVARDLVGAALQLAQGASSLHYLFLRPEELPLFKDLGFLIRHTHQYHWFNNAYRSFDDFIAGLPGRKQKQVRKEREMVRAAGVKIGAFSGQAIRPEWARFFYRLYAQTIASKQAFAYLTPEFFEQVFDSMRDRMVLVLAELGEEPIAGALFYHKGDTLFGRYWGTLVPISGLHFELCYYQGIEYAIAHGLRLFEAGAQGEHKRTRGFVTVPTYSAHWIQHPAFRQAIGHYIEEEKKLTGL